MAHSRLNINWISTTAVAFALITGCATPEKKTAIGAGVGGAAGAGIGAIAGGGTGALIGLGVGAAAGGLIGNQMDKQAQELREVAAAKRTQDGILVNLKGDLLFDTGSANLKPSATNQLTQLSGILVKYPNNQIQVAGHTDNTGSAEDNQTLSMNRAQAVKSVLTANGVKDDQIKTYGYGESSPVATNSTKAGQAKNRRVDLIITDAREKEDQKKD